MNNNIQDEDVIDYNEDVDEAPAALSSSATLPQSDPDHAKHAEDVQLRAPPSTSTSAKKQQVDTAVDRLSVWYTFAESVSASIDQPILTLILPSFNLPSAAASHVHS